MKAKYTHFITVLIIGVLSNIHTFAAPPTVDSLALVDLYNSTNGPGWSNHEGWLAGPVNTWYGVSVISGQITDINLDNNNLSGNIPTTLGSLSNIHNLVLSHNKLTDTVPSTLGNLVSLQLLALNSNYLIGAIPAELGNLVNLQKLYLANNSFSGTVPATLSSHPASLTQISLENNRFNFDGMEAFAQVYNTNAGVSYTPQYYYVFVNNTQDVFSVTAGGTLANNIYKWYNNGVLVKKVKGDSTYRPAPGAYGTYNVQVSNVIATALVLSGIEKVYAMPANLSDSLVLVELYNTTGGPNWINRTNWLSGPVDSWYGIISEALTGRVNSIAFGANNLKGTIPSSIGTLSNLTDLLLDGNAWTGTIPASFANLSKLVTLSISSWGVSHLSGPMPGFLSNLQSLNDLWLDGNDFTGPVPSLANVNSAHYLYYGIYLDSNRLNFDSLESVVKQFPAASYSAQRDILPLHNTNNKLSVYAGGTLANNTYKWYQNGVLVNSTTGDSTYSITSNGSYSAQVTNSIATALMLQSDTLSVSSINLVLANTNTTSTQLVNGRTLCDSANRIISIITPAGANPVTGSVFSSVSFDAAVQFTASSQPYLQRHYDIVPASNAATATAMITLFFTQAEFTAYNIVATAAGLPLLPVDGTDADGNKAFLRITQYHGTGTKPGNYSGFTGTGPSSVLITPNVFYNSIAARWEVSFPVTGFSGFFVSTSTAILPVTLLNFTAAISNKQSILTWHTAGEIDNKGFDIEKSADANTFKKIGYQAGHGTVSLPQSYTYVDIQPFYGKNFYRLKQTDFNGKFTYSNIAEVTSSLENRLSVYPIPASNIITVKTINNTGNLQITDMAGRILQTVIINSYSTNVYISTLHAGIYICKVADAKVFFVKQ